LIIKEIVSPTRSRHAATLREARVAFALNLVTLRHAATLREGVLAGHN